MAKAVLFGNKFGCGEVGHKNSEVIATTKRTKHYTAQMEIEKNKKANDSE